MCHSEFGLTPLQPHRGPVSKPLAPWPAPVLHTYPVVATNGLLCDCKDVSLNSDFRKVKEGQTVRRFFLRYKIWIMIRSEKHVLFLNRLVLNLKMCFWRHMSWGFSYTLFIYPTNMSGILKRCDVSLFATQDSPQAFQNSTQFLHVKTEIHLCCFCCNVYSQF